MRWVSIRRNDGFALCLRHWCVREDRLRKQSRESFELSISRPRVLFQEGPNCREEPYETIDVGDEFAGTVVDTHERKKMAQKEG